MAAAISAAGASPLCQFTGRRHKKRAAFAAATQASVQNGYDDRATIHISSTANPAGEAGWAVDGGTKRQTRFLSLDFIHQAPASCVQ